MIDGISIYDAISGQLLIFSIQHFYMRIIFVDTTEATTSLLDLLDIESICSDSFQAMKEVRIYRELQGSFARRSALTVAKTLQPGNFYAYITN